MWIFLNQSFLSIVHKDCDPDELLVRARRSADIVAIFPDAKVQTGAGTDYRFRARIQRTEVAAEIAKHIASIDYGNFKNTVSDGDRHTAYMGVWSTMMRFQRAVPTQKNARQSALWPDHKPRQPKRPA